MKKPQFKLLKEFKTFISKGSALDLAVGMIIGTAFTAIVSALVSGILQPLINMIPISETGDLITELRAAVIDPETGAVIREALVLDWGAVISAVITFILTALVLFVIIKAINSARDFGSREAKKLAKKLKKGNISEEEAAAAKAALEAQQAAAPVETTDDLLREIRDLLRAQQAAQAQPQTAEPVSEQSDCENE